MYKTCIIFACFCLFFVNLFWCCDGKYPEILLCADTNCSTPISTAKGMINYHAENEHMLSFQRSSNIDIYSKSAAKKENIWGAKINGRSGFIHAHMVKEIKKHYVGSLVTVHSKDFNVSQSKEGKEAIENKEPVKESPVHTEEKSVLNEMTPSSTVIEGTTFRDEILPTTVNENSNLKTEYEGETVPAVKVESGESEGTGLGDFFGKVIDGFNNIMSESLETPDEVDELEEDEEDDGEDEEEDEVEDVEDTESTEESNELKQDEIPKSMKNNTQKEEVQTSEELVQNKPQVEAVNIPEPAVAEALKQDPEEVTVTSEPPASVADVQQVTDTTTTSEPLEKDLVNAPVEPVTDTPADTDLLETDTSTEHTPADELSVVENVQNEAEPSPTLAETSGTSLPPVGLEETQNSLDKETTLPLIGSNYEGEANPPPPGSNCGEEASAPPPGSNYGGETSSPPLGSNYGREASAPLPGLNYGGKASPPPLYSNYGGKIYPSALNSGGEVTPPPVDPNNSEEHPASIDAGTPSVPGDSTQLYPDLPAESTTEQTTSSWLSSGVESDVEQVSTIGPPRDNMMGYAEPMVSDEASFLSGMLNNVWSLFSSGQKEQVHHDNSLKHDVPSVDDKWQSLEQPIEGTCKSIVGLESNCEDAPTINTGSSESLNREHRLLDYDMYSPSSYQTVLYLIITSVTVLLFTLGYFLIEKFRQDQPLIAKINSLEQELLVASKECALLKNDLETNTGGSREYETSQRDAQLAAALTSELETTKARCTELESQVESLQQELETATEAGLELNKMLTEVFSQQHNAESLLQSVEQLQNQLDSQQRTITEMNERLTSKNAENETLQSELSSAQDKVQLLDEELGDIKQTLTQLIEEKDESNETSERLKLQLDQVIIERDNNIASLTRSKQELESQLLEVNNLLTVRDSEYVALKDTLNQLKNKSGDSNLDKLLDVGGLKAELARVVRERDSLKEKVQDEEGARKLLEGHVKSIDEEVKRLRTSYEEADKEKVEAQTKLQVLSSYFKEKETQLQKELGLQEAMWVQKQGDESTIFERMKSLEQEVDNYKSQNEILKKEILDQERGLKGQIATLEKKAHENWVAARQAERKLEESKQEAGQLRNRLTMIEKNIVGDVEGKTANRTGEELNGGEHPLLPDTSSPLLYPPIPLEQLPHGFIPPFMPPPMPPPFLPGDRRPPPLGRMSSPPLNNRFTPPSPDYDRLSPPPPQVVRNYRSPQSFDEPERDRFRRSPSFPSSRNWDDRPAFRPVTSKRREQQKGPNLSSGHSSSESLDKSTRSGKV